MELMYGAIGIIIGVPMGYRLAVFLIRHGIVRV